MSEATEQLVEQAQRLCRQARLLPAEESAKVLDQAVTVLQAAQAEVLVEAERCGDITDSGCRSVRSFGTTILHRSVDDASQLARVAHHLVDFPKLAAAYRDGTAHTGNLRTVVKHIRVCGLGVLQAHEEQLVLLATQAGPEEIRQFCMVLADLNKPDRDKDKVTRSGARMVRIARLGDLAHLDAMLEPGVAMQLKATLTAMARAARTPDDPRSHPERCADALEQVLAAGMAALDTTPNARGQRRPRRHVVLHAQLETLLGLPGHGAPVLARFGLVGTPTAERLACDALVTLVLKHGDTVLNVGRARRLVSPRQHTGLAAVYSTCVVPGCRIPFADCEIHHLWWWRLGGPTDFDLQLPLCQSHHIWLHEGGYSITREDDQLVFRDPKGRLTPTSTRRCNTSSTCSNSSTRGPASTRTRCGRSSTTSSPKPKPTATGPTALTNTAPGAGPAKTPAHHPDTPHRSPTAKTRHFPSPVEKRGSHSCPPSRIARGRSAFTVPVLRRSLLVTEGIQALTLSYEQ